MWAVRVYGASSGEQVLSDCLVGYPYMVATAQIALVDGTVLDSPLVESHPRVGAGQFVDGTNERKT